MLEEETHLHGAVPLMAIRPCLCFLALWSTVPAFGQVVTGLVAENSSGQPPVINARITIFEPGLSFFDETRTDTLGQFIFNDVPEGVFRIGASAFNLEYVETSIQVGIGAVQHDFQLGPETEQGSWDIIGDTLPELFDATDIGVLRPDGTVFYCHDTVDPIAFDPVTGTKSLPAGSGAEQGCMNGTLLNDGRIIMVGGQNTSAPADFRNAVPWVKSYDSVTNQWQGMNWLQFSDGRWYPGLARLADGSLLVMGGGTSPNAARTATCELFDPIAESWSFVGSLLNPTEFPPCALLHTGEVLATWWPPQLYNSATATWRSTGHFVQPNRFWPGHSDHSIVVMDDGRVAAIGVVSGPDGNNVMAEIYEPDSETWTLAGSPGMVRFQSEVVQLPDGRILVAGGETEAVSPPVPDILGIVKWSDLFDPADNSWRRVADMNWFREYHAVSLLVPDGRVLTTGGTRIKFQFGPTSADIEAYSPPYLFRGVRPQISAISNTVAARGCALTLEIQPATQITSVVLLGTGVTTHWVDAGVPRRLVLPVAQQENTVTIDLPTDQNLLPLGHYILFAMVDDIPSVGRIIRVRSDQQMLGDVNLDGERDGDDIAAFSAALVNSQEVTPCDLATMDGNDDGVVDGRDVEAFVQAHLTSP